MKTFRHPDDPNIPGKNSLKEEEQIICFFFFLLKEKEFDISLTSVEKHCWKHVNLRGGKFEFVNTTINILIFL